MSVLSSHSLRTCLQRSRLPGVGTLVRGGPPAASAQQPVHQPASLSRRISLVGTSSVAVGLAASQGARAMQTDGAAAASVPKVKLNSGHSLPLIGLGTSGLSGQQCTDSVASALKLGFRHIESAQMYGNEQDVGAAVGPALSNGLQREDLFITSKLRNDMHAPEQVEPAVRDSLKKLQVDYLDLFLIHWPFNPEIEPETWKAMEALVEAGQVRSLGVSNFSPEKVDKWFGSARIYPAVNQVEVHCHWRNDRLLQHHKEKGINVMAYAPLSSPSTMASQDRKVPNLMTDDESVQQIAKKMGKTPAQVLLAWGLQHGTSVIPRSSNPEHQKEILGAASFELSQEDYQTLTQNKFQLKYFSGEGLAIGEGKPYSSYQELWDEEPTQEQKKKDYA